MASPPFPSEPHQLSNDWLTSVLCDPVTLTTSSAVVGHEWTPVAMQGAAAIVGRVQLTYDRPTSAPPSVVVKFATPHAPIRAVMHRFGFYRTEVEFYRQIGEDPGVPTPRCYAADIDSVSGHFVLVLEDMSDSRVGGGAEELFVADVELAIDHLVAFHARWWNSARLRELTWLAYPGSPGHQARLAGLQPSFGGALQAVRQRLGSQFPDVLDAAATRMLADWPAYFALRAQGAHTLVHRDFHPQQLFFPSERGGRFAVFDWQTTGIGRGGEDLARIVSMGLTTAQRAAHDRRLIERYHAGIVRHGVADYSLSQCVDDFRLGLTGSLLTNVIAAASIDLAVLAQREAETGVTLMYAIFDRLASAFRDHEVLGTLSY